MIMNFSSITLVVAILICTIINNAYSDGSKEECLRQVRTIFYNLDSIEDKSTPTFQEIQNTENATEKAFLHALYYLNEHYILTKNVKGSISFITNTVKVQSDKSVEHHDDLHVEGLSDTEDATLTKTKKNDAETKITTRVEPELPTNHVNVYDAKKDGNVEKVIKILGLTTRFGKSAVIQVNEKNKYAYGYFLRMINLISLEKEIANIKTPYEWCHDHHTENKDILYCKVILRQCLKTDYKMKAIDVIKYIYNGFRTRDITPNNLYSFTFIETDPLHITKESKEKRLAFQSNVEKVTKPYYEYIIKFIKEAGREKLESDEQYCSSVI